MWSKQWYGLRSNLSHGSDPDRASQLAVGYLEIIQRGTGADGEAKFFVNGRKVEPVGITVFASLPLF